MRTFSTFPSLDTSSRSSERHEQALGKHAGSALYIVSVLRPHHVWQEGGLSAVMVP